MSQYALGVRHRPSTPHPSYAPSPISCDIDPIVFSGRWRIYNQSGTITPRVSVGQRYCATRERDAIAAEGPDRPISCTGLKDHFNVELGVNYSAKYDTSLLLRIHQEDRRERLVSGPTWKARRWSRSLASTPTRLCPEKRV